MTKAKFMVSLAANYMTLDAMQASPDTGLHSVWQRWLAYLQGHGTPHDRIAESFTVEGNSNKQGLAILFQRGLDRLKESSQHGLAGSAMEVVLGPTLSHVGVLDMVGDGKTPLSDADRSSYVDAWIAQTWGIRSADCVVSCVAVAPTGRYLISCIERHVVDAIHVLCQQESIRLTSCKPAVAIHLAALINQQTRNPGTQGAQASQALRLCVFVERELLGGRSDLVQFLVLNASGPVSALRMWLPNRGGATGDTEIDRVIDRLRAQHHDGAAPSVDVVSWPRAQAEGDPG